MKPKPRTKESAQLFQQDLEHLLDQRQPLYKLTHRIDWDTLEKSFVHCYKDKGRPALSTRLMIGLLLLKQLENLSDEREFVRLGNKILTCNIFVERCISNGSCLVSQASWYIFAKA